MPAQFVDEWGQVYSLMAVVVSSPAEACPHPPLDQNVAGTEGRMQAAPAAVSSEEQVLMDGQVAGLVPGQSQCMQLQDAGYASEDASTNSPGSSPISDSSSEGEAQSWDSGRGHDGQSWDSGHRNGETRSWDSGHIWNSGCNADTQSESQSWYSSRKSEAWSWDCGCKIEVRSRGKGQTSKANGRQSQVQSWESSNGEAQNWGHGSKGEVQSPQGGHRSAKGRGQRGRRSEAKHRQSGPKMETSTQKATQQRELVKVTMPSACPLDPACSVKDFKEGTEACSRVEEALSCDNPLTQTFFQWMFEFAPQFAMWKGGTRIVQRLLEVLPSEGRSALVAQLMPCIDKLYDDLWGNHVLTKVIEEMPLDALGPLIQLVQEKTSVAVAKHKFGCRVLDRLIDQTPDMASSIMKGLIDPLVDEAAELAKHPFGNFVIKHILEHDEKGYYRSSLVQQLLPLVPELASLKVGSHLAEELLRRSRVEEQQAIATEILRAPSPYSLEDLAADKRGSFLIGDLLALRAGNVASSVSDRLAGAPQAQSAYLAHVAARAAKERDS